MKVMRDLEFFAVFILIEFWFLLVGCFFIYFPDLEILTHLNAEGRKMYSHLHKFKTQQILNGGENMSTEVIYSSSVIKLQTNVFLYLTNFLLLHVRKYFSRVINNLMCCIVDDMSKNSAEASAVMTIKNENKFENKNLCFLVKISNKPIMKLRRCRSVEDENKNNS